MAGRNRMPLHSDSFRGFRDDPRSVLNRGPGSRPFHPAALEDELEIQHREMQRTISENRLVIDDNKHLQWELEAAKDEIHRLGQIVSNLRADKEVQARELIDRGLKLEAEIRVSKPLREEVVQLRAEVQNLTALRQELTTQVQGLTKDITWLQAENQQLISMRSDIDAMHKVLIDTRRAFEFEKKANEEQIEQNKAMERNLISMAHETDKLRAEQLNAERRARDGGGYMLNGSPEMRYSGGAFGDGYGGGWGPYDRRGHPRR